MNYKTFKKVNYIAKYSRSITIPKDYLELMGNPEGFDIELDNHGRFMTFTPVKPVTKKEVIL